jgi:histidinol phosphatase-like PHP family hydrolase
MELPDGQSSAQRVVLRHQGNKRLDGARRARAIDLGIPAVAFTDHIDLMAWHVAASDLIGYEHFQQFVTRMECSRRDYGHRALPGVGGSLSQANSPDFASSQVQNWASHIAHR